MRVAFDVDGTLDVDPSAMASLLSALQAAGHQVVILTGASSDTVDAEDVQTKKEYLNELGVGKCWDTLVVFPDPPHKAKAKWCKKNNVDILFDNNTKNAKYASKYCLVMAPWNSIVPSEIKDKA